MRDIIEFQSWNYSICVWNSLPDFSSELNKFKAELRHFLKKKKKLAFQAEQSWTARNGGNNLFDSANNRVQNEMSDRRRI